MLENQCLFSHGSVSNCTKGQIFKIIYFKFQIEFFWILSIGPAKISRFFQDFSHDFLHGAPLVVPLLVGQAIHTHQWQRASREDDELEAAKRTHRVMDVRPRILGGLF